MHGLHTLALADLQLKDSLWIFKVIIGNNPSREPAPDMHDQGEADEPERTE